MMLLPGESSGLAEKGLLTVALWTHMARGGGAESEILPLCINGMTGYSALRCNPVTTRVAGDAIWQSGRESILSATEMLQ
jgi:hypothetical protein